MGDPNNGDQVQSISCAKFAVLKSFSNAYVQTKVYVPVKIVSVLSELSTDS